jgi:hypothetical protein
MIQRQRTHPLLPVAFGLAVAACVCTTSVSGIGLDESPTAAVGLPTSTPEPEEVSPLRADEVLALEHSPATYIGPNCFADTNAEPTAAGERPCTCSGEVTVVSRVEFSADGQAMTLERTVDGQTSTNEWTRDPQHREQWLREVAFQDGLAGDGTANRTDRLTWTPDGYQFSALVEFSDDTTTFCKPRVFTRQP